MNHEELLSEVLAGRMRAEDVPLSDLDLSFRSYNALSRRDWVGSRRVFPAITTLGELVKTPIEQLLKRPHFGKKCLREVRELLRPLGLELSPEKEKPSAPLRCSVASHARLAARNKALLQEVRSLRDERKRVALKLHREHGLTRRQIGELFGKSSGLMARWAEDADRKQRYEAM